MSGAAGWWRDDAVMLRFVSDLVAAELTGLRPTGFTAPSQPWSRALDLRRELGVDSLELVAVAGALSDTLHLHESGIEDRLLVDATLGAWADIAREGLEHFSESITFRTSGSTGDRTACRHELATLWQEVDALAPRFLDRRRVLSAVRSHHIYGFLFTVLLPRRLAHSRAPVVHLRHRLPSSVRGELREGDLVVGFPDFWRGIASNAGTIARGVVGTTSTAPCPAEVAHALANQGLDALVEIYGSSETAGVGVRSDPDAPYELHAFWERAAQGDPRLVRTHPDGTRVPVAPQDRLEFTGDRHFHPAGRIDHALQIAGVNVFPARVRRVLMEHPEVLDAVVRPMRTDGAGRLKAFVVPRGSAVEAELHVALEGWVASRLSAPERPKAFTFGSALPLDDSGKPADWPMAAHALS